ncbi:MAG: histidine--tRNA ligase [Deltaproteobacteria bacterium]|nr:histidine--tRNA ligase [Deltaproteobacteria bacterium]
MFQKIKGTRDVLSPEVESWTVLESRARHLFQRFGYSEIRPPAMEWTELFARGIGEATDIVEKEMYSFSDSQGRSVSLRPEATAGIVRAFIENKLYAGPLPRKLFTIGPMFRHERPQKGRFRQFHQIDVELFGDPGPAVDAELIAMGHLYFSELGLGSLTLFVNSLGCPACRPEYRSALLGFLASHRERLCEDCRRRLDTNPLRILDCKVPTCKEVVVNAPCSLDHLCMDCDDHFSNLKRRLDAVEIPYQVNPRLVRGLDYYSRTAFELVTTQLGAQDAVMGGGRYDGLVELFGGPPTPAIGFAIGMERLHLLVGDFAPVKPPDLYVAALGPSALERSFTLVHDLRSAGISVDCSYENKSLKSQMKHADRLQARFVCIIGDAEIETGRVLLRNMQTKEQAEIDLTGIAEQLEPLLTLE